ncbi:MAG: two-component system sensor histidine kinase CreC [Spirochaetes bacterium]|nr:two-component system sensor histidine kinase CreC [Spirochaetota bacterium]
MKIKTRILISFIILISLIFYFFLDFIRNDLGKRYMETVEESLIDTAYLLASLVESEITSHKQDNSIVISTEKLAEIFQLTLAKKLDAQVFRLRKTSIDLNVYVANQKGIIIYDAANQHNIGQDYSDWRDVHLTLKGKYGARLSSSSSYREFSDAFYIAAPIGYRNKIIGSLTVVKPKDNISQFIEMAKRKVIYAALIALAFIVLLIIALTYWITLPFSGLLWYVRNLKSPLRQKKPQLKSPEINQLADVFTQIFTELEGKKYIEKYVQALTHEIKSPLSSIRGAAELLDEKMPVNQQKKFIGNIQCESKRIEMLISRLLQLSSLENRNKLEEISKIYLYDLINEIIEAYQPQINQKKILVKNQLEEDLVINGEIFLLRHGISNLFENAIKFSNTGGTIKIYNEQMSGFNKILIEDQGSGIPDFALPRIFERFYSLPPVGTQMKSTGLGLSFVKEAIELHEGKLEIHNNQDQGVTVTLFLPIQ